MKILSDSTKTLIITMLIVIVILLVQAIAFSVLFTLKPSLHGQGRSTLSRTLSTIQLSLEAMRRFFENTSVVVIDSNGTLYRVVLELLNSYGIEVHRFESTDKVVEISCPEILMISLDSEIANEMSLNVIDRLRECSMNGSYVSLAFSDVELADKIWRKLFEVSLPYTSSEITITKKWRDGRVEYVVEKTFFIFGRTYKSINGRLTPVDVAGSARYRDVKDLEKAMKEALSYFIECMIRVETELSNQ